MAEIIRSAKPDDWTQYELDHFRIRILSQNKQEFFGSADLHAPDIPSLVGFMSTENREHAVDGETRKLLHYLDLVLDSQVGRAAAENFATKLLEMLGYDSGDRIIFTQRALPIVIGGVPYIAETDICVMDKDNQVLLLLQGEERVPSSKDPESQVVAMAIAAFTANNKVRETSLNLPPLSTAILPAITMIGTNTIFYKITVSSELRSEVQKGCGWLTRVFRYIPVLPRRHGLGSGMLPLENRVELLACLEAFKQFVGN